MEISVISGSMFNMESKIKIFESKIEDGLMSNNKKFYPKEMSQEEIDSVCLQNRIEFAKKHNIDGKKIYRATQKNTINKLEYQDGKYLVVDSENITSEDAWYYKLVADILILPYNNKKIGLAHQVSDCPVIIAEDRKKGVTALSHCSAVHINRLLPQQTIEVLQKEFNSNVEDIYVYIGSCAHKEEYTYDKYPLWATNKELWTDCIMKQDDLYHIDMLTAIRKQLEKMGIKHIEISKYDTITNKEFYSHADYCRGNRKKDGYNVVGFYYK